MFENSYLIDIVVEYYWKITFALPYAVRQHRIAFGARSRNLKERTHPASVIQLIQAIGNWSS